MNDSANAKVSQRRMSRLESSSKMCLDDGTKFHLSLLAKKTSPLSERDAGDILSDSDLDFIEFHRKLL
jgi:hypothetical protein